MKVYFNNKSYNFTDENISSFHLLLKSLEKIGEKWENIDNYYIASAEGHPMNKGQIVKRGERYYLRRRVMGSSSLYEKGNSYVITIFGSIFFGILSITYYNFYLRKTIVKIPEKLQAQFDAESVTTASSAIKNVFKSQTLKKLPNGLPKEMPKEMPKGMKGLKQEGGLDVGKYGESVKGGLQKFGKGMSNFGKVIGSYINQFVHKIQDNQINLVLCNLNCIVPSINVSKKQENISGILSFALFSTYIFMLLMPLITNGATTISCKSPGFSKLGIPFLLLLIPLVLVFVLPYIIKGIEWFAQRLKNISWLNIKEIPNFNNYKLAISNTILLVLLVINLVSSKSTISPLMGCMIIIALILFGLLKYFPTINNIIGGASEFLSKIITNTQPPPEQELPQESINLETYMPKPADFKQAREFPSRDCWIRYRFFFDWLWTIVMTLIGWGLMTGVYASQVRKHCKMA